MVKGRSDRDGSQGQLFSFGNSTFWAFGYEIPFERQDANTKQILSRATNFSFSQKMDDNSQIQPNPLCPPSVAEQLLSALPPDPLIAQKDARIQELEGLVKKDQDSYIL